MATKGFLFVTGLIFVAIGLRVLVDPVGGFADYYALQLSSPSSFSQIRAANGGVTLLLGLYQMYACFNASHARAALLMVALVLGGLLLGECYSLVVDGRPNMFVMVAMAVQLLGLVQAVALRQQASA